MVSPGLSRLYDSSHPSLERSLQLLPGTIYKAVRLSGHQIFKNSVHWYGFRANCHLMNRSLERLLGQCGPTAGHGIQKWNTSILPIAQRNVT